MKKHDTRSDRIRKPNGINPERLHHRLKAGDVVPEQRMVSVKGVLTNLLKHKEGFIHLQFRRFAGCPVCNLHLQSFVRADEKLRKAGIREIVVFHSPEEELKKYESHLPFDVIADPAKRLYVLFGVEASPRSILHPKVWGAIVRAVFYSLKAVLRKRIALPPVGPHGGSLGLPADFLIASHGHIVACKYGIHANDQWTVNEVLNLADSC